MSTQVEEVITEQVKLSELRVPEAHLERETFRQHWQRCPGCEQCWPESFERNTDI
jgi:hypothetical protein